MPMNLVAVSLDGVSQTLFWQYRQAMPCLWRMSERSAMFRRFYSAATSSLHSFCSFVHGDASELDHNLSYPDAHGCLAGRNSNLFSILQERGYQTLGIPLAPAAASDDAPSRPFTAALWEKREEIRAASAASAVSFMVRG